MTRFGVTLSCGNEIAGQVGFAGGTSLREHLHAAIGVSPLAYRRTFRGAPA
jgi:transcriptional regulator GlxA family with amidase domain